MQWCRVCWVGLAWQMPSPPLSGATAASCRAAPSGRQLSAAAVSGAFGSRTSMISQYFTELQQQLHASWASLEARGVELSRLSSPAPQPAHSAARCNAVSRPGPGSAEGLPAVAAVVAAAAGATAALRAAWAALAAVCWRVLELAGALYLSMRYFTGAARFCTLPLPVAGAPQYLVRLRHKPLVIVQLPRRRAHMLAAVRLHVLQRAGAAPPPAAVPHLDHLAFGPPLRGLLTCARCGELRMPVQAVQPANTLLLVQLVLPVAPEPASVSQPASCPHAHPSPAVPAANRRAVAAAPLPAVLGPGLILQGLRPGENGGPGSIKALCLCR